MEKYFVKLKHIAPTFIYINAGTLITVALVRLAAFQFDLFELKEEVWELWIPLLLPWIPITIWLRPKLRILVRKKDSDRMQAGFQALAWASMFASMLVMQLYLKTAMGELENITDLKAIHLAKQTRFVTVQNFDVLTSKGGSAEDIRSSGKYNEHLDITLYFVAPIVGKSNKPTFNYWYGVKFKKQISNRLSDQEKDERYKAFYRECIDRMNHYPYHDQQYFSVIPFSDDREAFLRAVERVMQAKLNPVILQPETGKFEERNGTKLFWIFGSFGIGLVVFMLFLALPRYSVTELERQHKGYKVRKDDIIEMLRYLIPKEPHFATSIILDINLVVFLVMIFSGVHVLYPNGIELMQWGASRRNEVIQGEWWRLITSMFVHGGVMHLLFNIYGLYLGSTFLEMVYGAKRYALVYVLSGLIASISSLLWHEQGASVGASGAIFGVFGAILSFTFGNTFQRDGKRFLLIMFGPFIGLNLLFGFAGIGIDNAAHIGGLVCGLMMGLVINHYLKKKTAGNQNSDQVS